MESVEFNFYEEVQKHYKSILPRKEEMLAIFILHQKISLNILDPVFSHDNIIEAIDQAYEDQGKTNRKKSAIRDNEIIHNLRPYFIRKESKGYSLRGFAKELCKLIESELQNRFNPSQIEIRFKIFHQSLQENLHSEENFIAWFESTFDKSMSLIKNQLEVLHNSVDATIDELNQLYSSEVIDFADKLREMDAKVKGLGSDTKQLGSAFQLVDDIMMLINSTYTNPDSYAFNSQRFREIRKEIKAFFDDIEHGLAEVSFSVDRVKPQLERLYGSFEQRELDRKLEKFVLYLFKNSFTQKVQSKDEVFLPESVPIHTVSLEKTKFLFPTHYQFSEQSNQSVRTNTYDKVSHDKLFDEMKSKIELNRKAVAYFRKALSKIKDGGAVDYNEFFFDLLKEEDNLEIALKTTHLLLREVIKTPGLKMQITPNFQVSEQHKNIAIWNTQFRNLNS